MNQLWALTGFIWGMGFAWFLVSKEKDAFGWVSAAAIFAVFLIWCGYSWRKSLTTEATPTVKTGEDGNGSV